MAIIVLHYLYIFMKIVKFKPQTPIILLTGFLGSGKSTLLCKILQKCESEGKKVAVIQNEFAQTSFDSDIIREVSSSFTLRELNTGSIFCACLFSQFRSTLIELSNSEQLDIVIVEATGIADPIAIAQLLEDSDVSFNYYLSHIVSVVDAPRFEKALKNIIGVRHQIQVADTVHIAKIDLVDKEELQKVQQSVKAINPIAKINSASYADFDVSSILDTKFKSSAELNPIDGELTKCGEGGYKSKCFKSTKKVTISSLTKFLESLSDNILRVKGYVSIDNGSTVVVQYVPGQIDIKESQNMMVQTELVSIGYEIPPFEILL
ncbi:MAG: CobW family GTP-binding protein [Rikenellaceae bacterium]